MRLNQVIIPVLALAAVLAGCGERKFKVSGNVEGGEGKTLLIEKSDFHGRWVEVDSAKISSSGAFSIAMPAPASPEIYRLRLGEGFIYFPVDSTETVTVEAKAESFGKDFTLGGSEQAGRMGSFEHELMALDTSHPDSVTAFKKRAYADYIMDSRGSVLSYYILTKYVDGKPLYNPENRGDAKYYAAVATQFDMYRPDDPHGRMVKEVSLAQMKKHNRAEGRVNTLEAGELALIDIALPDASGKTVRLSDIAGKGKKTVLVFSLLGDEKSPAFNRRLNTIYEAHKGNVEFYHVGLDADQYAWRDATANLPWITVNDPAGTASTSLVDYNVGALPAVFIYNAAGDLTDRPQSLDDLNAKL